MTLLVSLFVFDGITLGALRVEGERIDPSMFGEQVIEGDAEVSARMKAFEERSDRDESKLPRAGEWVVPSPRAMGDPCSGTKHISNTWGDTSMGIGFAQLVNTHGAYVSSRSKSTRPRSLQVIGYRGGVEVARSGLFRDIDDASVWFPFELRLVDRITFEAEPGGSGAGWFDLDDLTFTRLGSKNRETTVLDFEDITHRTVLSGSNYAGLKWEYGQGDVYVDPQAMPYPQVSPRSEEDTDDTTYQDTAASMGGGGTPPLLKQSFLAFERFDIPNTSFPPDTMGAVGPDHFVVVINNTFAIFDKETGTLLANYPLNLFYPDFPERIGDPRVLYDQHSGRWISIASGFEEDHRIYLAVSLSDDPLGPSSWFKTSFLVNQGVNPDAWADYPTLGVDENGIYVAADVIESVATIFAIDKSPLIAPVPSVGAITAFRGLPSESGVSSIQPAHMYGAAQGEYLIVRKSETRLLVLRIDPPLTNPTLVELGDVCAFSSDSPSAPALGSTKEISTIGDARLMMAVYRNGSLWTTNTVGSSGRAACKWYEIDPVELSLIQSGTVKDPSLHFYFPSIMVNSPGHAVMGFSGSDENHYIGAYYTGRLSTDPLGEMASPIVLHEGEGPHHQNTLLDLNRWGDYSYTTLDPNDERTIWTIQEYAAADHLAKWGLWVGSFGADCNGNGQEDLDDITLGTSQDCNENTVPDECEPFDDCNVNGIQDICDVAAAGDCNGNGMPDDCDFDCDGDGKPEECEHRSQKGACCVAQCPEEPQSCTVNPGNPTCTPFEEVEYCHFVTPCACSDMGGSFEGLGVKCLPNPEFACYMFPE